MAFPWLLRRGLIEGLHAPLGRLGVEHHFRGFYAAASLKDKVKADVEWDLKISVASTPRPH